MPTAGPPGTARQQYVKKKGICQCIVQCISHYVSVIPVILHYFSNIVQALSQQTQKTQKNTQNHHQQYFPKEKTPPKISLFYM